jgi:hypothetical protein
MRINVRIMATRDQILRGTTFELELAVPASLGDALQRLVDRDQSLVGTVFDTKPVLSMRPGFALLLNGVSTLHAPDGLKTPVVDGDTLSIIHGITGG